LNGSGSPWSSISGADRKRIEHAFRVAGFAERIWKEPETETVLVTALLHDIGIKKAERKSQLRQASLQSRRAPGGEDILERLGYSRSFVAEVCQDHRLPPFPGISTANSG
jgi:HD superfamily phosphodiesterase